jgi:3',5'-cyclic AMP phosphodiesterase CpdA
MSTEAGVARNPAAGPAGQGVEPIPESSSFCIVHLSDLHVGKSFDEPLWKVVCDSVTSSPEAKPGMIIVSGDLVDGLRHLQRAVGLVDALARRMGGCRFIAVPGNHDVRFGGWFPALFRWARFTWGRVRRAWDVKHRMGHGFDIVPPVAIYVLDSNAEGYAAAGGVAKPEILEVANAVTNIRRDRYLFVYGPRVAVVHHHPLPVPRIREGRLVVDREEFMVLKNAGTLLAELARQDFDLVLHGHRHHDVVARWGYEEPSEGWHEIMVVGAGTATLGDPDPGHNSFNLVFVDRFARMRVKPVRFDAQRAPTLPLTAKGGIPVHSLDAHKAKIFRRATSRHEISIQQFERHAEIIEDGSALIRHVVRGLSLPPGGLHNGQALITGRSFSISTDVGRFSRKALEIDPEVTVEGITLGETNEEPTAAATSASRPARGNRIRGWIDLGEHATGGEPVTYGLRYVAQNSFFLTEWEAKEMKNEGAIDHFSAVINTPCERLVLRVGLAAGFDTTRPFVRVCAPFTLIGLEVDEERRVPIPAPPPGTPPWHEDKEMTRHEQGNLRLEEDGAWLLEVDHPLVGYKYSLNWKVHHHFEDIVDRKVAGMTTYLRERLLEGLGANAGASSAGRTVWTEVDRAMSPLLADLAHILGSPMIRGEELRLGLWAYDTDRVEVRQVFEISSTGIIPTSNRAVPLGEGPAGAAMKRRMPALYSRNLGSGEDVRSVDLFPFPEPQHATFHAILGVPWFHPSIDWTKDYRSPPSPKTTIGAITFASTAPDSRLHDLPEEEDWSSIVMLFQAAGRLVVDRVLEWSP